MFAPLAAGCCLATGAANAEEVDTENKCRECLGIGINPCESQAQLLSLIAWLKQYAGW